MMNTVTITQNVGLLCLVVCSAACFAESSEDSVDMRADMNQVMHDMSVDVLDMEDVCENVVSRAEFTHVLPVEFGGDVKKSEFRATFEEASQETLGAIVKEGELLIFLDQPRRDGNFVMKFRLETSEMGNELPGVFCVDDVHNKEEARCEGKKLAILTVVEYRGEHSSSSVGNVYEGMLNMDTCPNEVGDRVLGSFEEMIVSFGVGDPDFTQHKFSGSFDVFVIESDRSLRCDSSPVPSCPE